MKKSLWLVLMLCLVILAGCGKTDFKIEDGILKEYTGDGGDVIIPDGVTSIENNVFRGCTDLTSIIIPDGLISIGRYAFKDCVNLSNITFPSSIMSIGDSAFLGCTNLTNIIIPNSVSRIETSTFEGCTSLIDITLPSDITIIGENAFRGCTSLTSITVPDEVTSIGCNAFNECSNLSSINVSEGNERYASVDGVLFDKNKTKLIRYPAGKEDSIYNIPNEIANVGDYAFNGCTNLTEINIHDEVTKIGVNVFDGCTELTICGDPGMLAGIYAKNNNILFKASPSSGFAVTDGKTIKASPWSDFNVNNRVLIAYLGSDEEVVIPKSITTIGKSSFAENSQLKKVILHDDVTSIEDGAFRDCTGLTYIKIPDGVTSIGSSAFQGCSNLTGVVIPKSVQNVGDFAFYGCESLKNISIPDSIATIGILAFPEPDIKDLPIEKAINKAVGLTRVKMRGIKIEDADNNQYYIKVLLNANDNLTTSYIRLGMYDATETILRSLKERDDIKEITFEWWFPLTDMYGDSKDTVVSRIIFEGSTIKKINFDSFDYTNIPRVADVYYQHGALN